MRLRGKAVVKDERSGEKRSAFVDAGWVKGISALAPGDACGDGCGVAFRAFIVSCSLGCVGVAAGARAADLPVHGAAAGEVKIDALAELGLKWDVAFAADGVVLRATRPGVALEVTARPEVDGAWSWRVERGEIDLGEAWPMARALAGEAAAGWSASGRIEIAGEGAWSPEAGPTGEARIALREGWAKSDELEVEVSGIELDVIATDLAGGVLPATQRLRVARVTKAGTAVEEVRAEFGLNAAREWVVAGLTANFLGGRVKLKPFTVSPSEPKVRAGAEIEGLLLTEAARLMPWAVARAEGKLKGRIVLAWDEAKGLRVLDGGLDIVRSDAASFRLAPSPGLLTGDMPKTFKFLKPEWTWARWIGMTNPAYRPMRKIEMGETGMIVDALRVTFWPDGEGVGRTATVHVEARPTAAEGVKNLVIDLNFHGPWSEVMAFGLNQEASFGFKMQ